MTEPASFVNQEEEDKSNTDRCETQQNSNLCSAFYKVSWRVSERGLTPFYPKHNMDVSTAGRLCPLPGWRKKPSNKPLTIVDTSRMWVPSPVVELASYKANERKRTKETAPSCFSTPPPHLTQLLRFTVSPPSPGRSIFLSREPGGRCD